jgi:hypothetical protein
MAVEEGNSVRVRVAVQVGTMVAVLLGRTKIVAVAVAVGRLNPSGVLVAAGRGVGVQVGGIIRAVGVRVGIITADTWVGGGNGFNGLRGLVKMSANKRTSAVPAIRLNPVRMSQNESDDLIPGDPYVENCQKLANLEYSPDCSIYQFQVESTITRLLSKLQSRAFLYSIKCVARFGPEFAASNKMVVTLTGTDDVFPSAQ